jgi:hypothetical protein
MYATWLKEMKNHKPINGSKHSSEYEPKNGTNLDYKRAPKYATKRWCNTLSKEGFHNTKYDTLIHYTSCDMQATNI